jgi:hypothetical protein
VGLGPRAYVCLPMCVSHARCERAGVHGVYVRVSGECGGVCVRGEVCM